MSLVGPTAPDAGVPAASTTRNRHDVTRSGLGSRGWPQISGRNAISWEEKFALDIEYVDNHDLRMDMAILIRTIGTVVSGQGVRYSEQVDMPEFLGSADQAAVAGREP